jgi:CubicO group peptidase (beta-lactamase class C family)
MLEISTPEKEGLDALLLLKSDDAIRKNLPSVLSFMVVRHGRIVYEKYYQGNDKDSPVVVYSITKSVVSALTGIAIREGYLPCVDRKLTAIFPQYFADNTDLRKKEITLKHLLTMTGGLEPADVTFEVWGKSSDCCKYVIDRRLTDKPGEKFEYNSGLTHVLAVALAKTTGMTIKAFADKYLFGPMGITNYTWQRDRQGYYTGGWGLRLMPRDMAKFGYLYLMNGIYEGRQLVPQQWVKESVSAHSYPDKTVAYGYCWWLDILKDSVHNVEYNSFFALGYGGQFIWVVPELDIITVITVKEESPEDTPEYKAIWHLIHNFVIPSVK